MSVDYAEVYRLAKKGRKSEDRAKALGGCLSSLTFAALVNFYRGWIFMLVVGVIHAEWIHQLPTIGYWWSVLVSTLLSGALSSTSSSKKST